MQNRTFIGDLGGHIEKGVTIAGFVDVQRNQGKLVFLDLRDMSGVVQAVVLPASAAFDVAKDVRQMYAVAATGTVNKRPEKNVNPDKQNGDIELKIESLTVLSKALPLP